MLTRKQYLANECTHEQYYCQFVNSDIIQIVIDFFGESALINSYKENIHFNTFATPLRKWNRLAEIYISYKSAFIEKGDCCTLSGEICILKEAARQFVVTKL